MNILSLCDGASGGHMALDRAGIKVDNYYAAEIKEVAIKVTKANYPDTVHIGDVNKVSYKDGVLHTEVGDFETSIDLVIFGSPCQTFSIAIPADKRIGLHNLEKSGLFYECLRILHEVNPKYWLMENVASMRQSDKDIVSNLMGVQPIQIDSEIVAPALRDRLYWTNIPVGPIKRKNIKLQDILDEGWTDREKARCLTVIDSRPNSTPIKMFHRYYSTGFTTLIFKSEEQYKECCKYYNEHYGVRKIQAEDIVLPKEDEHIFEGVRYLNQNELERCQTVPPGYTKCLTRNEAADVMGDGWTVDIIAWLFSGMVKPVCNVGLFA